MKYPKLAIKALLLLNLFDAVFTLTVVTLGWGYEANPVMALVLSYGPVTFMAVKVLLGTLAALVFWVALPMRLAILGAYTVTASYAALALYHVASLVWVLFHAP